MIDADAAMLAYMPCRIGMLEDAQGRIWILAMLIDEAVIRALPAASAYRSPAAARDHDLLNRVW